MEILSVGEKIKRARIYQGITLKELCGDKISLSKMSCIENGKVKVEEDILEYIAHKLKMDYNYLAQDIKSQLVKNLSKIDEALNGSGEELSESVKYNLDYAIEYNYMDIAFKLFNKLFNIYLNNNDDSIQDLIVNYTDMNKKNISNEQMITYYSDMAEFYFRNKEFNEAIYYLSRVKSISLENEMVNKKQYILSCYKIALCYEKLNYIEEAYRELESVINEIEYIDDRNKIGDAYTLFVSLSILLKKEYLDEYSSKIVKFYSENINSTIDAKLKIIQSYFSVNYSEAGKRSLQEIIEADENKELEYYPEILLKCVEVLYDNAEYIIAQDIIEEALNLAICSNDPNLIEKAYYLKGMILQKQGRYIEAENYMNIAIDSLIKFATKEERYIRYNEMGELYYNLGEYKESVKYFSLAINEKNKLNKAVAY